MIIVDNIIMLLNNYGRLWLYLIKLCNCHFRIKYFRLYMLWLGNKIKLVIRVNKRYR
jgi:hypothetical protein